MKISDLLRLSFDNLKRRKGRTVLTVLGVIIGTCSIVMMVSIGVALDKSYDDMLSNMGDLTLIEVYNWSSDSDPLTDSVVESFAQIDGVRIATPLYTPQYVELQFTAGSNDKYIINWCNIKAINRQAIEDYGYELTEGRFPNQSDKEYTMIVGEYFAYEFVNQRKSYPNNVVERTEDENGNIPDPFVDVMHDKIKLKTYSYSESDGKQIEKEPHIVGVVKRDTSKGYETMYGVIMDLEDVVALEKEYMKANDIKDSNKNKPREYSEAIIKVNDINDVDDVVAQVEAMGYYTYSATSIRNEMKKQTQMIQLILGGLGSIAMIVSAISIANTMTMAIYERTKEIGIMKVLGCSLQDIKNMFLAEAAGIGFLGGSVGIIICYGLSKLLNVIGGSLMGGYGDTAISIIPLWLAAFGLGFSTLVGIISGYVPAVRAVKITALSAIRHD